jgi:hypothetical protein
MKVVSSQTWCITSTGERVPEGHPLARFLLVGKGCEIEDSELERYPLVTKEEPVADLEEEEDEADDVTEIVEGQPVKRPRGRPRKLPITE